LNGPVYDRLLAPPDIPTLIVAVSLFAGLEPFLLGVPGEGITFTTRGCIPTSRSASAWPIPGRRVDLAPVRI
jgi:hypothetical protein